MNLYQTKAGDLIQLVSPTNKVYTFCLSPGEQLQTHRGILYHDDLIGAAWGSQVFSHNGNAFYLLQPALSSLIQETRRNTQIMYPKDIGFLLITMSIGPGIRVIEAGTGSGALTTALAWAVGPQGEVFSYEVRPEMHNLARKNLQRLGLEGRVSLKLKDIQEGFDETGVDALFLDLPNPFDYVEQVRQALKPGGFFGCILPTTNQVARLLSELHQANFAFEDVCEIMLRYYKPVPLRLRPTDRMVAHTGYLVFARPILHPTTVSGSDLPPLTEEEIARRLTLEDHQGIDSPYPPGFIKQDPRPAAVLIPLLKNSGAWHVLYIRRTANAHDPHGGQVAFPGGATDPGEASPEETALREAFEEIGLHPSDVKILGRLIDFVTVTSYRVTPIVGVIPWPYPLSLATDEVSKVFTIPLEWLADPANHEERSRILPDPFGPIGVIYFKPYDGELLWGASARFTTELISRLF